MSQENLSKLKVFNLLALLNLLLAFCMVLLGAYVKNSGSSLACPDWPTCHGSLFPEMSGGVLIEHSHRILGAILGLLSLSLLGISWGQRKTFPSIFRCSLIAVVMVVTQGIFGGVTVLKEISPWISAGHWMLSQFYVATLLWLFLSSRNNTSGLTNLHPAPKKLITLANVVAVVLLIQFLLGAIVRHFGAATGCGVGWENAIMCQDLETAESTIWPSHLAGKLHMKHRIWGVLTFFVMIFGLLPVLKWAKQRQAPYLRKLVVLVHIAVTIQVLLGMKVVGASLANYAVLLHVAFAMLLWILLVSIQFHLRQLSEK